jgi:hypothetical protein
LSAFQPALEREKWSQECGHPVNLKKHKVFQAWQVVYRKYHQSRKRDTCNCFHNLFVCSHFSLLQRLMNNSAASGLRTTATSNIMQNRKTRQPIAAHIGRAFFLISTPFLSKNLNDFSFAVGS